MFTPVAISAKFVRADGTPSSGSFSAELSSRILNSNGVPSVSMPSTVSGLLDSQGRLIAQNGLALVLDATDDSQTTPYGAYYSFVLSIDGVSVFTFDSPVPCQTLNWSGVGSALVVDSDAICVAGSAVVELVDTVAATSVIGTSIASAHFTGSPVVVSIDPIGNTLTLSSSAVSSGTGISYSKGIFPLTTLMENRL